MNTVTNNQTKPQQTKLYASFYGKRPRCRKPEIFSVPVESAFDIKAIQAFVTENKINQIGTVAFNRYVVSESSFVDHDGVTQTIFFKSMFPISCERSADISELLTY